MASARHAGKDGYVAATPACMLHLAALFGAWTKPVVSLHTRECCPPPSSSSSGAIAADPVYAAAACFATPAGCPRVDLVNHLSAAASCGLGMDVPCSILCTLACMLALLYRGELYHANLCCIMSAGSVFWQHGAASPRDVQTPYVRSLP